MKCKYCSTEIKAGMKFCPNCGNGVEENVCSNCGQKCEDDAAFCPNCGNRLNEKEERDNSQKEEKTKNVEVHEKNTSNVKKEQELAQTEKDKNEKGLKKVILGVLVLLIALGSFLGVRMYKEKAYMNEFADYVNDYKQLSNQYIVSAFQEQYDVYVDEAEDCIREKKKGQIENLWTDMEDLKRSIISSNEKVKKYQEIYVNLDERFKEYILDDVAKKELKDYTEELSNGIKKADVSACESAAKVFDEFERKVLQTSLDVLNHDKNEISNMNQAILYEVEREEFAKKLGEAEKLVAKESYIQAEKKYEECKEILSAAEMSQSYQLQFRQVDVSAFPTVKLYMSALNLATGEVIENLDPSLFSIREKIGKSSKYKETKFDKVSLMNETEGLNTAIVADASASMGENFYYAQNAMASFVQSMQYHVNDRGALYSFADTVYREQHFTSDQSLLNNAIYNMGTGNMTALYDALVYAISDIIIEDGAKCVIAFTDGMENNSESSLDYVISKAKEYDIPIYIIGLGNGVDEYALGQIASQTGGFYRNINSVSSMEEIYREIYREQKSMYVMKYKTAQKSKADLMRALYIKYQGSDYTIRTEVNYIPSDYKIDGFIFHDSDSRYLETSELERLSEEEVLIALNEIYARRGYKFQTNVFLIDHFNRYSWYKGKYDNQLEVAKKFNKYEKKNVDLLVKYEKENQLNSRSK